MSQEEITWLSTGDAAKRLGITTRTLYRFLDEGELPPGIVRNGESNDYEIDLMVDLDDDGVDETTIDGFASFTDDPEDENGFAVGEGATINASFGGPLSGALPDPDHRPDSEGC